MRHRAEVLRASIEYFVALDSGGDAIFGGKINFDRIGLMGHSRGGEAVVVLPEVISVPGARIRGVISLAPTDAGASSGQPSGYDLMVILPAGDGDVRSNPGAGYYDQATPDNFRSQLYIDGANHNYFNRHWPHDEGIGPNRPSRGEHERILSSYGAAFFRTVLLGHNTHSHLVGTARPAGAPWQRVHLSFGWRDRKVIDHHEDGNGIGTNSLGAPTAQIGGLVADEVDHRQSWSACNPGDSTYYGNTTRMEVFTQEANGQFRSELDAPVTLRDFEVWVRIAEVHDPPAVPAGNTRIDLGAEWATGNVTWVNSDHVGGVPAIYDRGDCFTKTMLTTLRFPGACFGEGEEGGTVIAIRYRLLDVDRQRKLTLDDLELVENR